MAFDVKNKTVLVTGANRGIGKAILEEALQRGATKVYAAVRDVDSASPLIAEHGDRVVAIAFDLEDPASIVAAAKLAADTEVVVNNAGVLKSASAIDPNAIDSLQYEMNVNVYGLMRVAQAFAPVLKSSGGGALVQLNSVVSVKTFADVATYSASKAASYAITQGLRDSLRDQNTQVVSVHPGPIQTDMATAAGLEENAEPPSVVAMAIFDALAEGRFHVWPDSMAKQIGAAYQSFAENVVDADMEESPA
ncbi:SDR family oxidoreductase [Allorhodopirellula heiligendammensis]|uniref:1-deoxy-11-beta-hydroxypentalenate dehydrogenase n=1 Tax=Allorhodopirellula heiligendammensis TaxID=2714739 RepID=A0A5C6C0P3_9BACT|nr:SDR family oxidoreductase [Allorhodopirellula heiligendammensis]TWU18133.1 1-deoxy-11-beta-hydroxypentalenate dehydrogenase [Allorhodopirellula heiligendammensis]